MIDAINNMGARRARILIAGGVAGAFTAVLIKEVLFGGNLTHRLLSAAEADPLKVLLLLALAFIIATTAWLSLAFTVMGVAHRKGYPRGRWFLIGLAGGVVALSAALAMEDAPHA